MNLDPSEKHTDEELWKALELAHLKEFIEGKYSTYNSVNIAMETFFLFAMKNIY